MPKQYTGAYTGERYYLKYRLKGSSNNFTFKKYTSYKNMIKSAKMYREKGNKVVTHIMGKNHYSRFWNLNNRRLK